MVREMEGEIIMDVKPVLGIHEVADEAAEKLLPFSTRAGQWIEGFRSGCSKLTHQFRHPLLIFMLAVVLILALTNGDSLYNFKVVIGSLIVFGIVWTGHSSFNFEADSKPPVPQEADPAEVEDDLDDD